MKNELIAAPTLITCHGNADWDALSSMIGASLLYPDGVLVFPGSMEKNLTVFFNETASCLYAFRSHKEIDPASVRRIVIVDTQRRSRVQHIQSFLEQPGVSVEIWDHHPTQEKESREACEDDDDPEACEQEDIQKDLIYADIRHIRYTGSTCTIICQELQRRKNRITCQDATILGLGIYGDTGAFTYSSTRVADFHAAAWLRGMGMDLPFIADLVHTGMTSLHIRALNALLESATVHEVGNCTVMLADVTLNAFLGDFAYLAQKFMEMERCDVLFALAALDDKVQVVARSRVDAVDVGRICKQLGGGGHRMAASASVKDMPVPELKDAIFQHLYAQVHPDKRARDLMTSPAKGVTETQSIRSAEELMTRYGLKAAPVFRPGTRHCVGYIEAQIASKAITHNLGEIPVSEYMQRTVLTVSPDASLQRLIRIIVGAHQRLIPIVEKNQVIGVVTRTDLINMFVEDPSKVSLPMSNTSRERNLAKLLTTRLPRHILDLLRRAGELGDEKDVNVYAVGGFVRDIMLSRPVSEFDDVDLVVEGDGIVFAKAFATLLGGRVREHRTFMTALVIYKDENGNEQRLDVATARLEYYQYPAALPTVELSSIKMDLFRRDFTINAMALRLNKPQFGSLVDFFGGQGDVQRKTIRVIHALSFVEDPTRIVRAVRFEQRYGFHISVQGEKLIKNALSLNLMEKLSGARVMHELNLICREKDPGTCFIRLNALNVLTAIHPSLALNQDKLELLSSLSDVIDWYRLLYLEETPDVSTLYLLALCSAVPYEETATILTRLGFVSPASEELLAMRENIRTTLAAISTWYKESQKETPPQRSHNHPQTISEFQPPLPGGVSQLCALLSPLNLDAALYLMARTPNQDVRRSVSQYIYKWRQIQSDVTGEDLRQMGLDPGPLYGAILRKTRSAKLDGIALTREAQLSLAREMVTLASCTRKE